MSHFTNRQRVGWAASALAAFRVEVGDDDNATLIQDLIADLGHLANSENLNFPRIAARGISTWAYERREPNGDDPNPQVSIIIAGRRLATHAWTLRQMGKPQPKGKSS